MPAAVRSGLSLQNTAHIDGFGVGLPMAVQQNLCPCLSFSIVLVTGFPVPPPPSEFRWVLQATSALAQLQPGMFCCILTAEAAVEETLLKIPVPNLHQCNYVHPQPWGDLGFQRVGVQPGYRHLGAFSLGAAA